MTGLRRSIVFAVLALGGSLLANHAAAQDSEKPARIGILSAGAVIGASAQRFDALRVALRELGHVEGRNLALEFREAQGDYERLPALAEQLVRSGVAVILAESTQAASAARGASATLPIVAIVNSDPVESGLAASFARPGGNVTGVAVLAPELIEKRLDLFHEAVPRAKRVAALFRAPGPQFQRAFDEAGGRLGLAIEPVGVHNAAELKQALNSRGVAQADGVLVTSQTLFRTHRAEIVAAMAAARRPAIYSTRDFVEAGGLMSYGPSVPEAFRRAASYVDRVLRGAKPGDLPIEQPTAFELVINLRTARALGLSLPQSLLARADEVIE